MLYKIWKLNSERITAIIKAIGSRGAEKVTKDYVIENNLQNSKILLDKITNPNKKLCSKEEVLKEIRKSTPELLLTLGAGDIDQLVKPLKEMLIWKNGWRLLYLF